MEMRSCLLLLLSRTARTKAAFFSERKGKQEARTFMFFEMKKAG